jgi:small GTP-binding protein
MLKSIGNFFAQGNQQNAAAATAAQRNPFPAAKPYRLVVVGDAGGGKTTLLKRLRLGKVERNTIVPSRGVNVEELTILGKEFTVWDVAGTWSGRSLWSRFALDAAGIICVVDSSDEVQIEETKEWLWRMCEEDSCRDMPLLVFANKQDRLNALSVKEVKDKLDLERRARGRRWHIRGSIATTGDGLMDGMDWIATQLRDVPRTSRISS